MRDAWITFSTAWTVFSLIVGMFIWYTYEGKTETGAFFMDGNSVYWLGYLGEVE